MNKHHVILFLVGVGIGYFACSTLSAITPWSFVANSLAPSNA